MDVTEFIYSDIPLLVSSQLTKEDAPVYTVFPGLTSWSAAECQKPNLFINDSEPAAAPPLSVLSGPARLPGQARTALRMRSARPIVAGKQRSKANLRGGLFLPAEDNWLAMIMNAGPAPGPGWTQPNTAASPCLEMVN